MALKFTLRRRCLDNVEDVAVRWQIEGGDVLDEKENKVGTYSNVKRVSCGTMDFNTAQVWLTLFFKNKKEGKAPDNMTLHGAHDFNSGNEIGSVSAASLTFSAQIGKPFDRTNDVLVIG